MTDNEKTAKRAAVSVTPKQVAAIGDTLARLALSGHGAVTAKQLKGTSGVSVKIFAAACRQLVAEGKAEEIKRGAYQWVYTHAKPPNS